METTQSVFGLSGSPATGSFVKSLGIHVFMLGLLLLLPAQAILRQAAPEKSADLEIVFHRPPEATLPIPAPAVPATPVRVGVVTATAGPASAVKPRANAPAELAPGPQPGPRVEPQPQPQPTAARAGILAFKDQFANVAQNNAAPRLGADARYGAAADAGQPSRSGSTLTAGSPGSSGGINAASLNRSVSGSGTGAGGGNGNGGIPGVGVGRATSAINSIAAEDRPKPQGERAGARTDEEIQIVFDRYKASFYRLYNRALRNDPSLKGQMVLRLTIEPDGSVSMCKMQSSDLKAPDLADQVLNVARTINFGAKGGPAVTIVYPIDFLPAA